MANKKHLAILKNGVRTWNKWRRKPVRLGGPNLIKADLIRANLRGADLNGVDLGRANLRGADLNDADLRSAHLNGADLRDANLRRANLKNADLRGADLSRADLKNADLRSAHLNGAHLNGADLLGADFNGADVSNAIIEHALFSDIDLSQVKGLLSAKHHGPSTIGIDTIYKSKGEIPEAFLRAAGVPEPFITHMKALVGAMEPIQFYSCFISYSTKDQDFAERLHADLQSKGVRCWLATEDLKIGDKIRSRIEDSIRVHDKLLLVLSKASLASPWVEDEVESALERERRESRLVLFPIRIDDAVKETDVAWAVHLRQKRHIGEFSRWKDHDAYRKAFERLLRDLKADARSEQNKNTAHDGARQNCIDQFIVPVAKSISMCSLLKRSYETDQARDFASLPALFQN
jgi:TIR domain/Pentapeptide repeats (8 copies)